MIEIYFDGVKLNEDNYMSFDYSKTPFDDSFYLGATPSVEASLVIPKDALPQSLNEVVVKIDGNNYLVLYVEEISVKDDEELTLTLVDKMASLSESYDISEAVPITAKNLLNKICTDFSIPHDTFNFTNQDVVLNSYDDGFSARNYVSMIAELAGGYAFIDSNGKMNIATYLTEPTDELTTDDIDSYKLGTAITIQRLVYEFGAIHKETDNDTSKYTLYLDSSNLFLQNITDAIFQNIANNIIGFTFYNINIPNCNIFNPNATLLKLTGLDNSVYKIINQFSASYFGNFTGSYETKLNNKKKEITKIEKSSEKVKKLAIIVDQENNRITQLATKTEQLEGAIELLDPVLDANLIVISTDANNVPFSTKNYSINYVCKYLGTPISLQPSVTPDAEHPYQGITCAISSGVITFSVNNTIAIQNTENRYLFTWTYTDQETGTTFTTVRAITVSTASSEVEETVIIGPTAPTDTSLLWYDTTENLLKSYVNDDWQDVNIDKTQLEGLITATQNNTNAINGTVDYFLTEDTSFVENKKYYTKNQNEEYIEYSGPTTGNPHELELYEANITLGLNQKYSTMSTELQSKIDESTAREIASTITNSIIQEETYTKLQVQQIVDGTGVDGVKVSAVVSTEATFNKDGMNYSKTGAKTQSTVNEAGMSIHEKEGDTIGEEVFFSGYVTDNRFGQNYYHDTLVYTHNLLSTGYTEVGTHGRFQEYPGPNDEPGVGFFII